MIRARHLVLFSTACHYGKPLKRPCAQQASQITGHGIRYNSENPCCNPLVLGKLIKGFPRLVLLSAGSDVVPMGKATHVSIRLCQVG